MYQLPIPPSFTCDLERQNGRAIVRPVGELDLGTARTLEKCLEDAAATGPAEIVLDLRGVEFIGSTGVRVVLAWIADSQRDGFRPLIIRGPRPVQRVFELAGFAERLPFVDA